MELEWRPVAAIDELRAVVRSLEERPPALVDGVPVEPWRFGAPGLDRSLGGGLAVALHMFRAARHGDTPAAQALMLALAAGDERRESLLWVTTAAHAREWGRPYGPGLRRFGIDPDRLLFVEAKRASEAGWAIEEGLKSGAFGAVLAAGPGLSFADSRRLSLTAVEQGCACFVAEGARDPGPLAAATLWSVTSRPALPDSYDAQAPGAPAWRLELLRARGRSPGGVWELAWDDAAHRLALAPGAANRAAAAPAGDAAEPVRAQRGRAARG